MRSGRQKTKPPIHWLGVISLVLVFLAVGVPVLAQGKADSRQGENAVGKKTIQQVLREYTGELMSLSGVVGTAEGRYKGEPCIEVYVIKRTAALQERIPTSLDGYRVIVKETGKIRGLSESPSEPSAEK